LVESFTAQPEAPPRLKAGASGWTVNSGKQKIVAQDAAESKAHIQQVAA
jgi:hypothetical protein